MELVYNWKIFLSQEKPQFKPQKKISKKLNKNNSNNKSNNNHKKLVPVVVQENL